eukprot:GHVN01031246.1.p1 GENE.GHVN01031246.1~~GHVN01031246.1.p1  ORF type:complete len:172 (-),score=22.47 GHVN01031246.1:92-607(-)
MWSDGHFDELVSSAKPTSVLRSLRPRELSLTQILKKAERLMRKGKTKEASRLICIGLEAGVHRPENTYRDEDGVTHRVLDVLKEKHPEPAPFEVPEEEVPDQPECVITSDHVAAAGRKCQGAAGPGGTDAYQMQQLLFKYGAHSAKIRDAVAALCNELCNNAFEWKTYMMS